MNGLLLEVVTTTQGSAATADVAVGETSVPVENLTDFASDGGRVDIAGTQYDYTELDGSTVDADGSGGALVLASPLTTAVAEFDPVLLLAGDAPAVDYYAIVDMVDDESGQPVWVPIRYADRLAFPVRAYDPPLPVTVADDLSEIVTVNGVVPQMDGALIDPDTLPTLPGGGSSDGDPPASSPTPVLRGGIGTLFVTWAEIANADLVTYDVHLSTVSGFTPDETNRVGSSVGKGPVVVRTLADGTPLVAGTTYYVQIVARDADGPADPGTEASGSPAQVNSGDIAAGAITADLLTFNDALGEALSVTDLSTVNFESVNINGGSVAIAVSASATHNQGFSGTAFPTGWTAAKSVTGGYSAPDPSVTSSPPAGGTGSAVLLDLGTAGQSSGSVTHTVTPDYDEIGDCEILVRLQFDLDDDSSFLRDSVVRIEFSQVGDTFYRALLSPWHLEFYQIINGDGSVNNLATATAAPWVDGAWYWARIRKVAGAVQLSYWRDGTTEPPPVVFQLNATLPPGAVSIKAQQNWVFADASNGQKIWIDQFDVTEISTGFKVNPDGTGSWPAIGIAPGDADWRVVGDAGEPAFENGWTATAAELAFRKSPTSDVTICGTLNVPASGDGTVIFTLPETHRPTRNYSNMFAWQNNAGTRVPAIVTVRTDGTVTWAANNASGASTTSFTTPPISTL